SRRGSTISGTRVAPLHRVTRGISRCESTRGLGTPGCARLAAIPELSFTRGLRSVPVRATLGMPCRVRRRITATKRIALLGTRQGVIFRPMLAALRSRRVEKLPDQVVLRGRILFLAEDADQVRRQLEGEDIDWRPATKLRDNISTDEITPAYICYYY